MNTISELTNYIEFQNEMNRLSKIEYHSYEKTMKEVGISYLGECNHSVKLTHNGEKNMLTYGIYLASSDASNINVCPKSKMCRESCLVAGGYKGGVASYFLDGGAVRLAQVCHGFLQQML